MGGKFTNRYATTAQFTKLVERANTLTERSRELIRQGHALKAEADALLARVPPKYGPSAALVQALSNGRANPTRAHLVAELKRRLKQHQGNISAVARALNTHPIQVRRWARYLRVSVMRTRG